jgi:phosphate transport system permease protein
VGTGSARTPWQRSEARRKLLRFADATFHWGTAAVAIGVAALVAAFAYVLATQAKLTLNLFGLAFIGGTVWDPNRGVYGALPVIVDTLLTSAIALLIGVPLSLGVAIFLSEQSPHWLRNPLGSVVELLAAVPSVIYGFWGIAVLVPLMRGSVEPGLQSGAMAFPAWSGIPGLFGGTPRGFDILTAGVILAVMIVPTVSAVSREALYAVPQSQREAALSLGATRWEATRIGVLKYARAGIFGAVILGLGRAFGETMAVTMTIGNNPTLPHSLLSQGQTMASLIANEFTEVSGPLQLSALLEVGLVLLVIAFVINAVARLLVGRVLSTREAVE